MSKELLTMSAQALKAAYQTGALSPVEVCSTLLDHIEKHDEALNAWCLIDRDTTLQWAREAEQRYQNGNGNAENDGSAAAHAGRLSAFLSLAGWNAKFHIHL